MPLSYTPLNLAAGLACWLLAGAAQFSFLAEEPRPETQASPFAICGSPYGVLIARVMKDSLHTYWHDGESGKAAHPAAPVTPSANRLRPQRPLLPAAEPAPRAPHSATSWLDQLSHSLSDLEARRTQRNSTIPLSPGHKRFINAAAGMRLRLAYQLDPGDPALYETMHFSIEGSQRSPQEAKKAARQLAMQTVRQGLSEYGSPSAALAGAGAMLNLLNNSLRPELAAVANVEELAGDWRLHRRCLDRYEQWVRLGGQDGWWQTMPAARRQEMEFYAGLLERLSAEVQSLLSRRGVKTDSP